MIAADGPTIDQLDGAHENKLHTCMKGLRLNGYNSSANANEHVHAYMRAICARGFSKHDCLVP